MGTVMPRGGRHGGHFLPPHPPGELFALDFILSHTESVQTTHFPSTLSANVGGVHMAARPHVGPWGDFNLSPDPGAHSMMDVGHWDRSWGWNDGQHFGGLKVRSYPTSASSVERRSPALRRSLETQNSRKQVNCRYRGSFKIHINNVFGGKTSMRSQ